MLVLLADVQPTSSVFVFGEWVSSSRKATSNVMIAGLEIISSVSKIFWRNDLRGFMSYLRGR